MTDGWTQYRAQPTAVGQPRPVRSRSQRLREARSRRRKRLTIGLSLSVLVVVIVSVVFLGSRMWHDMFGAPTDFVGDGVSDLVIEVRNGDTTTAIGQTLHDNHVVATVKSFVDAAAGNVAISSIQPGFYKLRTEIPAADAVERLADPQNRVGKLVIPEGRQLDDIQDVKTHAVTEGILTMISRATCVDLDGAQRCMPVEQLREVAGTTPAATLSVPHWAEPAVRAMGDDPRRLEGLIAAGTWNIDPSATPQQTLSSLISASATMYAQAGLLEAGERANMSPYEVLTVASLVQRESTPEDFAKVARVIYNRLAVNHKLEFDSTVNYPLDRQEVATTDADRGQITPWNTYMSEGLPATPICSPSTAALLAAEQPEPGDWLFFVTIDMQGTTLFTRDYAQHLVNIREALRNGVLDSAR